MFTVVTPTTSLSLDDHFIKRPAATFFVTVEGGGMAEHGILAGDTLIVDRSRTPGTGSIVIAVIGGELTARPFAALYGEEAPRLGRRRRGGAEPAMSIYGLADCNNFFVSCERVFRPALEGRPAVVLSSNDGCIVARSDEAKALGVKMAQPAFQAKNLIEQHSIAVISGNLQFYTDMSTRVMQAFGELVPAVEKYSIDECFLDLTGIPQELTAFCQDLKHTVRQWTGLPISIGIAETKTLAKIANRLAKTSAKTDGVLDLTGTRWRDKALASTEVGDIWGIGRQYAQKLNRNGIMTALDLTSRPDGWIRKEMGVGGLKTVRELRGEDCIGFDDMPQPKQTTMVSRSFGTEVRDYDELANAIAMFATDAARSIRTANLVASSTNVFIETNRFGKSPHHAPSRSEALSPATNNTKHVVRAALAALKHIYREGLAYKRAGVMLLDLVEAGGLQSRYSIRRIQGTTS